MKIEKGIFLCKSSNLIQLFQLNLLFIIIQDYYENTKINDLPLIDGVYCWHAYYIN